MYEWQKQIQTIVDEIDRCIKNHNDEALTLRFLSRKLGYSEFYTTRKFKEISGMQFRHYLRHRKLAFALKEVRDSKKNILNIAFDYGFSSHEAFTRAFKGTYGVAPSEYRKKPKPIVLRTKINPFDRYFFGFGEIGMMKSTDDIKIYFVTIPAHKFLHIKNYESNGYWDFWQKQSLIPGQNCETICGLLDSIKGKLDDLFHGKTEDEIDDVITDLAKTMSFNPLPIGVCLYDFRRGNCTDGDGCFFYNCPNYITEVQFYPILKDELDLLEKEMARLKELGHEREWQKQYIKYKYLKPLVESLEVQLNGKESVG